MFAEEDRGIVIIGVDMVDGRGVVRTRHLATLGKGEAMALWRWLGMRREAWVREQTKEQA